MKEVIRFLIMALTIASVALISCDKDNPKGCKCIHTDNFGQLIKVCGSTDLILPWEPDEIMYPNPATDFITLEFKSKGERIVTIKKKAGKELLRETVSDYRIQIDISDFPVGNYLLTIDDGKQKIKWCLFKE